MPIPSASERLPFVAYQNRSNDYQRTDALAAFQGQYGTLIGRHGPYHDRDGEQRAIKMAEDRQLPYPNWLLEPASFIPNNPSGADPSNAVPLHHITVMSPRPVDVSPSGMQSFSPRYAHADQASHQIINPTATAPPGIGTEVRMPAFIETRLSDSEKLSPTLAPGRFNDSLASAAINAALSGAPSRAVSRRVGTIADQYDQLAEQGLLLYMAEDAVARQLIRRAGEVPLSSANASILAAAQRHLAALPTAMDSPFHP